MSQASGIISLRARFFGPGRSAALPKRPLGIETLERRCPMDASAAIVGLDPEPVTGSAPPITTPPVSAIISTLQESPRSQGAEQRPVPLQANQNQAQNQTKTFTPARRAALAKRPLVIDPLQQPSLSGAVITDGLDDDAAIIGGDSPLAAPSVPPPPAHREESRDPQAVDPQQEPINAIESPGTGNDFGTPVEEPITAEETPLESGRSESSAEIVDEQPERPVDPSVGDDSAGPLAPAESPESTDVDCPAVKFDPIRFVSPPGPEGSIGLLPRARGDRWASSSAETEPDAELSVITGTTSDRSTRSLRSDSAFSQSRYYIYENSEEGGDPPADAFRSRTTPLRAFARQSEHVDAGIAIGATTETLADDAVLTQWRSQSTKIEAETDSEEDATASHAFQNDLAIAALVEEAAQAEQLVSESAESGIIATAVRLTLHEPSEPVQTCGQESGDDAVVALSPAQDFMINLSRWAALGLLVSHRLAHQGACRGGLLSWMSGLRARITGGRAQRY